MQGLAWGLPVLMEELEELKFTQWLQGQEPTARAESGDDLKARVLGGRTDQDDGSFLDMRKERILLSLVPSMNLVDEEETAASLEGLDVADPGEDLLRSF